jgi:hypothetical protein
MSCLELKDATTLGICPECAGNQARRRLVDEIAGCCTGLYEPDEAAGLKAEWPE